MVFFRVWQKYKVRTPGEEHEQELYFRGFGEDICGGQWACFERELEKFTSNPITFRLETLTETWPFHLEVKSESKSGDEE